MAATILFYISGHGFGHAVRQSFLINALPPDWHVHIISSIDRSFFEEELTRPFSWEYARWDCGCIQKDALHIDIHKTYRKYAAIHNRNTRNARRIAASLAPKTPVLMVSDAASFPAVIARNLGIPSLLCTNFTWHDIYSPFTQQEPAFIPLLREMAREYALFSHVQPLYPGRLVQPNTKATVWPEAALLRKAAARREDICRFHRVDPTERIVLLYVGNYGIASPLWQNLGQLRGYRFMGIHSPEPVPAGFIQLTKSAFTLQDYSGAADLILSKPGYGTVSEALSSQIPFLYLQRYNFAEQDMLLRDLHALGRARELGTEEMHPCGFDRACTDLLKRPRPEHCLCDESGSVAERIQELCKM
ncbi:MAG: hypothetical protein ACQEQV_07945 [Fibrobacterota bacterium]